MNIHMFDFDKNYLEVCDWWKAHKWPPVEPEALSTFGMITEFEGQNLCAGWLYMGNSALYFVEWLVTNPHAPLKIRTQGLECLIERLVEEGEVFGGKIAFTSVKSMGLIRMLKRHQFIETDLNMTNLVRLKGARCP